MLHTSLADNDEMVFHPEKYKYTCGRGRATLHQSTEFYYFINMPQRKHQLAIGVSFKNNNTREF